MSRARFGALAVIASAAVLFAPIGRAQDHSGVAFVLQVPGASMPDLLAVPQVAALARAGGAGLLVPQLGGPDLLDRRAIAHRLPGALVFDVPLKTLGSATERLLAAPTDGTVLFVVVGVDPSRDPPDGVYGIVAALGDLETLGTPAASSSEPGTVTSDSTRRAGVVSDLDVAPTVLRFLGVATDVDGSEIRIVDGPPPYDLYDRYLAQRRMYVPVGTAAALYVTGAGMAAIAFLARRRSVSPTLRRTAGWASLSVPMLATGLLAAGHLPDLSYATAVPMIAIVTVFGTMAFSPLERDETTLVPFGIGIAVLVAFVLEAASGWSGMLTPLLGGSQLDGARFYGLPNVALGLLVGSCLWVAHRLSTLAGVALLCAAGLFAGLPLLGADLGGAVTSFVATGLWVAVRERERLGLAKGVAITLAVTVIGAAVILVSHAVSPFETHVTRFEEGVDGFGGAIGTALARLEAGFDLIARNPAALVPVVGLPIALFVALRPPDAIRATFERWPAWRDAIVVTFLTGIVAYVANDTGPAAAGLFFGLGLGGMLGVSLLATTSKMESG